jgi:predicted TPR repeat methyltransferase
MNTQDQKELAFAEQYFHAGKADWAEAVLKKLLIKYPEHPTVLELLGYIAGNHGALDLATGYLSRSHQAQPDNASVAYYLAYCLQQTGRHIEAVSCFKQSLKKRPFSEGWRNLAISLQQVDEKQEALECLLLAKQSEPQSVGVLYDYATALQESGSHTEALVNVNALLVIEKNPNAYLLRARVQQSLHQPQAASQDMEAALNINPNDAVVWTNYAALLFQSNEFQRSAQASERALAIDNSNCLTWLNYIAALMKLKLTRESIAACHQVLTLEPQNAQVWFNKAMAHGELLETNLAVEAYQKAKSFGANASQIDYALAAYGAGEIPDASPKDYVTILFDNYADRFDEHLLKGLEYKVPHVMKDVLANHCTQAERGIVLDLGCGTGLFGSSLKPYANSLIGVDLSSKMLSVAKSKAIYSDLITSDILAYLKRLSDPIRLAVALDVFVYIGDLDAIFSQIRRLSKSGTEFAFSIEESMGDLPFQLLPSLRYAHQESYITSLATEHDFNIIASEGLISRKDRGEPIQGKIFFLRFS